MNIITWDYTGRITFISGAHCFRWARDHDHAPKLSYWYLDDDAGAVKHLHLAMNPITGRYLLVDPGRDGEVVFEEIAEPISTYRQRLVANTFEAQAAPLYPHVEMEMHYLDRAGWAEFVAQGALLYTQFGYTGYIRNVDGWQQWCCPELIDAQAAALTDEEFVRYIRLVGLRISHESAIVARHPDIDDVEIERLVAQMETAVSSEEDRAIVAKVELAAVNQIAASLLGGDP